MKNIFASTTLTLGLLVSNAQVSLAETHDSPFVATYQLVIPNEKAMNISFGSNNTFSAVKNGVVCTGTYQNDMASGYLLMRFMPYGTSPCGLVMYYLDIGGANLSTLKLNEKATVIERGASTNLKVPAPTSTSISPYQDTPVVVATMQRK